jgi:hypothetical protein
MSSRMKRYVKAVEVFNHVIADRGRGRGGRGGRGGSGARSYSASGLSAGEAWQRGKKRAAETDLPTESKKNWKKVKIECKGEFLIACRTLR